MIEGQNIPRGSISPPRHQSLVGSGKPNISRFKIFYVCVAVVCYRTLPEKIRELPIIQDWTLSFFKKSRVIPREAPPTREEIPSLEAITKQQTESIRESVSSPAQTSGPEAASEPQVEPTAEHLEEAIYSLAVLLENPRKKLNYQKIIRGPTTELEKDDQWLSHFFTGFPAKNKSNKAIIDCLGKEKIPSRSNIFLEKEDRKSIKEDMEGLAFNYYMQVQIGERCISELTEKEQKLEGASAYTQPKARWIKEKIALGEVGWWTTSDDVKQYFDEYNEAKAQVLECDVEIEFYNKNYERERAAGENIDTLDGENLGRTDNLKDRADYYKKHKEKCTEFSEQFHKNVNNGLIIIKELKAVMEKLNKAGQTNVWTGIFKSALPISIPENEIKFPHLPTI